MITRADMAARLKASLLDSVRAFKEADFERHVDVAFRDMASRRPRVVIDDFLLVPGISTYECPNDLNQVCSCLYGRDHKAMVPIWADERVGVLPELRLCFRREGSRYLQLVPMPSAQQISILGYICEYTYAADHIWTDQVSSFSVFEEGLLLLRAQAEAMRELGIKNASTPYQLREGVSATPQNGTPSYLFSLLMAEFDRKVAL